MHFQQNKQHLYEKKSLWQNMEPLVQKNTTPINEEFGNPSWSHS